ncbi:hypothetical protein F5148DRAFT_1370269 [Russula earlei]|uniref:Uncharacterized protein n=1 Tax=Russula earlei TaxID=71964 RepID=A0ACC0TXU8_9AGAM|nr:hypothetical protein F5148DRAFT_1370269 [Russula earlei]
MKKGRAGEQEKRYCSMPVQAHRDRGARSKGRIAEEFIYREAGMMKGNLDQVRSNNDVRKGHKEELKIQHVHGVNLHLGWGCRPCPHLQRALNRREQEGGRSSIMGEVVVVAVDGDEGWESWQTEATEKRVRVVARWQRTWRWKMRGQLARGWHLSSCGGGGGVVSIEGGGGTRRRWRTSGWGERWRTACFALRILAVVVELESVGSAYKDETDVMEEVARCGVVLASAASPVAPARRLLLLRRRVAELKSAAFLVILGDAGGNWEEMTEAGEATRDGAAAGGASTATTETAGAGVEMGVETAVAGLTMTGVAVGVVGGAGTGPEREDVEAAVDEAEMTMEGRETGDEAEEAEACTDAGTDATGSETAAVGEMGLMTAGGAKAKATGGGETFKADVARVLRGDVDRGVEYLSKIVIESSSLIYAPGVEASGNHHAVVRVEAVSEQLVAIFMGQGACTHEAFEIPVIGPVGNRHDGGTDAATKDGRLVVEPREGATDAAATAGMRRRVGGMERCGLAAFKQEENFYLLCSESPVVVPKRIFFSHSTCLTNSPARVQALEDQQLGNNVSKCSKLNHDPIKRHLRLTPLILSANSAWSSLLNERQVIDF